MIEALDSSRSLVFVIDVLWRVQRPSTIDAAAWDIFRGGRATALASVIASLAVNSGCTDVRIYSDFSVHGDASFPYELTEIQRRTLPGSLVLAVPQVENGLFAPALSAALLADGLGATLAIVTDSIPVTVERSSAGLANAIGLTAAHGLPTSGVAAAHAAGVPICIGRITRQ
jgi:hypothetical protein